MTSTTEDINPEQMLGYVEPEALTIPAHHLADHPHSVALLSTPAILAARHSESSQHLLDVVWIIVRIPAALSRVLSDVSKGPPHKECN